MREISMCIREELSIQPSYNEQGVSVQYKIVSCESNRNPFGYESTFYLPGEVVSSNREKELDLFIYWHGKDCREYRESTNDFGLHTFHNRHKAEAYKQKTMSDWPRRYDLKLIRVLCRRQDHVCSGSFSDTGDANSVWDRVYVPTDCEDLDSTNNKIPEAAACA